MIKKGLAAGFFLIILAVFIISVYRFGHGQNLPGEFTTNLDIKNQTINDSGAEVVFQGEGGQNVPLLANLIDKGSGWLVKNFNVWKIYQNLANPSAKYVVLNSGLRKEEVAALFGNELSWSPEDRYSFLTADQQISKKNMEGYYEPGGYLISNGTLPQTVYKIVINRFDKDIKSRYATSTNQIIDINLAMKIASIIEREAAGRSDMRLISGVIWNRLFKNMNLEMDATLQYAKGNNQSGWWPKVKPEDKYIDSPYNTYKNSGLPPTAIANVSVAALVAALNPQKTNCLFYLHDRLGRIHCSATYKQHQKNIKIYYK